jgi:hypothetical protein
MSVERYATQHNQAQKDTSLIEPKPTQQEVNNFTLEAYELGFSTRTTGVAVFLFRTGAINKLDDFRHISDLTLRIKYKGFGDKTIAEIRGKFPSEPTNPTS